MSHNSYFLLFLILIVCSCSFENTNSSNSSLPEYIQNTENLTIYTDDKTPAYNIKLIPQQTFGEKKDLYISHVKDIQIDEQNRVIIGDGAYNRCRVLIFEPNGDYLETIGGNGRGPGEFISIDKLFVRNNNLFVLDKQLMRISIFSLDSFELIKIIDTNPSYLEGLDTLRSSTPSDYYLRNDGNFLVGFADQIQIQENDTRNRTKYYIFNDEWEIISEEIFAHIPVQFFYSEVGGQKTVRTYSFMNQSLMDVAEDGTIYSAWSEDLLIKIHSPNGDYMRSFYYPFSKSILNKDDIINRFDEAWAHLPDQIKRWKTVARNVDYPETWPAIHDIIVDDENRIWIATITNSKTDFEWWVLDDQGKLLATFNWPGKKISQNIGHGTTMKIKNGNLYTYDRQDDASRLVTRYRIEFTQND